MSTAQVISLLIAATLLFWGLGAYNRLVRLRGEINLRFVVVHEQLNRRHDMLLRLAKTMEPYLQNDPEILELLRTCCEQVQAAADQVRLRPSAARRVGILRIAQDDLANARARAWACMPAQIDRRLPPAAGLGADENGDLGVPALLEELTAAGGLLTLAHQQFNEAVQDYNDAIDQFPTWILAGLFRFRSAGVI